jgi:methylated-DNA-[protein]-cysteine S-methyltransferase
MSMTVEIPTRGGVFTASFTPHGLRSVEFPARDSSRPATSSRSSGSLDAQQQVWLKQTQTALEAILAGKIPRELPPLDWSGQTEFRQNVWRAMLRIPPGKTKSYGEIALDLKKPLASRAVGGACGANPIPVLVPCHRILAANGRLGGFSGGLDWKLRLLAIEGIAAK